jgi:hypothetical protein
VCRRSRRRGFRDNLFSLAGLRPWRCRTCEARFFAWIVPVRWVFYVHCPNCGNMDLHHVARDRVLGRMSWLYRLLRLRAYRCDPCRHRFFSARPYRRIQPTITEAVELHETSTHSPAHTGMV